MNLSDKDVQHFFSIYPKLLYFAGIQKGKIEKTILEEDFSLFFAEEKLPARNALYDHPELFDAYVDAHKATLSEEDKAIILGFKNFERGDFQIVSVTKKYAQFLQGKYVFGVLALQDTFDEMLPNRFPIMVKTVLLPFKGQIVYDGIMQFYNIFFGKGIKNSVKNDFNKAKAQYGVITELPIGKSILEQQPDLKASLSAMMKTKASRDYNWYAIQNLINDHPDLLPHYYGEWGKINSRAKKKELKNLGITNFYFGIYNDTIVSSAKTKAALEKQLKAMIPNKAELEGVYIFKV